MRNLKCIFFSSIIDFPFFSSYGITMANAWMNHVKAVTKQNKGKSLKEILKMASKTYKKTGTTKKSTKKKGGMKKGKTKKRPRKSRKGGRK